MGVSGALRGGTGAVIPRDRLSSATISRGMSRGIGRGWGGRGIGRGGRGRGVGRSRRSLSSGT